MTISFARHQFPPAIIRHAVWLYVRFTLSYRDVEDLLAERDCALSIKPNGHPYSPSLNRASGKPSKFWMMRGMASIAQGHQIRRFVGSAK